MTSAPAWRKASHSNASGGNCVEAAPLGPAKVGLRDSKHVQSGHLTVTAPQFRSFLNAVKADKR
ncbi:uncharacterized protein DUF397 [Actinocorallia herbida]|uniref:Uncharacterized protein DUF397 n=1 Tax=Actinocorallia herbida TaxID=58109 RepID=A0A3N1CVY4_9ACTN|nr:DUF397 domain-containing protein [Actinocorallia herbida]ROO84878.1 uncharacterized protein DUF397 [Actinocorallia herbida]